MATYVDGFVLAVPKKNVAAYKKMAMGAGKIWKKHGALQYFECVGEDLDPKMPEGMEGMEDMKGMNFKDTVKAKPNETVFFSFIIFKSRAHRDKVNAKVMKEMMKQHEKHQDEKMPFDMKRMAYGGFQTLVEY